MSSDVSTREQVPFRLRTADGDTVELTYSSPRAASRPRREAGRSRRSRGSRRASRCRNWMLHEIDFVRRGRADLGAPAGARRGSVALREVARLAADRERDARRVRAGVAVLLLVARRERRPRAPAGAVRRVLRGARAATACASTTSRRRCRRSAPYGYLKNLVTLAGGGLVVRGGAIVHRMGLGSWQRGREVIWSKVLTALQVPIYLTIHGTRRRRAGRRALARLEDVRLQRVGRRERGGPAPDRVRPERARDRDDHDAQPRAGSTRSATATSARRTRTCS